ncbi:MAG: hypothetical protein WBA10_04715 [Elainellaceae cyanobacterium]
MASSNPKRDRNKAQTQPVSLESLKEQHLNLKLTVDDLQTKLGQTRNLLKTLILGLVIATLACLGVAGWLAYRLLVQEQISQRDLERASADATELQERLEDIEGELQRQDRQLQSVRDTIPAELERLTESVEASQRQLQLLRERLQGSEAEEVPAEPTAERSR